MIIINKPIIETNCSSDILNIYLYGENVTYTGDEIPIISYSSREFIISIFNNNQKLDFADNHFKLYLIFRGVPEVRIRLI